jgi:polar amino acid transport system substrate-binding protein/glutamate/aspartate transport system substrate-binding protein
MNNEGKIKPPVKIVIFQEHPQGLTALQKGIIDAYSTDGILLAGLKAKMPEPDKYELVDDLLTFDPYALVLPHDDSAFRNFVNDQLVKMIKDGRFNQLYKKWFGPDGVVPFPMSQEFKTLLQLEAWPE